MQQAQRILSAVMNVGVSANTRHREKVQLRTRNCER
jgi:hypothetical protein